MRVTLVAPAFFAVALLFVVLPSSCAGCSEECRDTKQGSEGCPCSTDQDCTTRLGEVLLCGEEGVCAPGDPPDAPADGCDNDGDCGDGELCGLGQCSPAPECQRIDVTSLRASVWAGGIFQPAVDASIARTGCAHSVTAGALEFTMDQIHPRTGAVFATGSCEGSAEWFAPFRAGVLRCDTAVLILADGEPCLMNAVNRCAAGLTCVALGSDIDEDAGVCR
jgi:hypothetical protein